MNIIDFLTHYQKRLDNVLANSLPHATAFSTQLIPAMHYAVFNGGKRLRPCLIYAIGDTLQVPPECLDAPAAAIELIHAYSLVHDDLPAMDNDDYRRGKPSCHRAYNEATAILVGDALLPLAFEIIASTSDEILNSSQKLEMIRILSSSSGALGMAGGQALDLEASGNSISLSQLEQIHLLKTGCLIQACGALAATAANASSLQRQLCNDFTLALGLAYQIQDDLLDIEGNHEKLGKPLGSDITNEKMTYPAILGIAEAKQKLNEIQERALLILDQLAPKNSLLHQLTMMIFTRDY